MAVKKSGNSPSSKNSNNKTATVANTTARPASSIDCKTEIIEHEQLMPQTKSVSSIKRQNSQKQSDKAKGEIATQKNNSSKPKGNVPTTHQSPEQVVQLQTPGRKSELTPRPMPSGNPYIPCIGTVKEIIQETVNIKTLRIVLDDPAAMASFEYEPGQVAQLSVFGRGESTFVINSPPSQKKYLQFSIMQAGEVTAAIHRLSLGEKVGLRAPLGNFFPWKEWKGKNIYFVGGGIGMAPIRTIMLHLLERKNDYGKISLLYGARSPKDMAYNYETESWLNRPDLDCTLCIDAASEGWEHKVGLIPNVLQELRPNPKDCVAVICGPPIMIKFTLHALEKLGFTPENIVTTLEKRMKCGIGICGRCNIGGHYVCVDGPVFTLKQLQALPQEL